MNTETDRRVTYIWTAVRRERTERSQNEKPQQGRRLWAASSSRWLLGGAGVGGVRLAENDGFRPENTGETTPDLTHHLTHTFQRHQRLGG